MILNKYLNAAAKFVLSSALVCGGAQMLSAQSSAEMWKDSATGLTWTAKDNGSDVNAGQARDYCSAQRTGGFSDWRLPTIDELSDIYDKSVKKMYKAKGPIVMSDACALSSSTNNSGEVWNFCFNYGGKSLTRASGHGSAGRALCVRKSE